MQESQQLHHLKKLSILMDSKFTGPFGFKFGLDGIIGLIPVLGDLVTTGISLYILFQAVILGCAPSTIVRMGLNILIENLVDVIPGFGNVFDFIWKSNTKNIEIIEQQLTNPRAVTVKSRLILGFVAFVLLTIFIASVALTISLFKMVLNWIALFSS
jgi:hypothetical protein